VRGEPLADIWINKGASRNALKCETTIFGWSNEQAYKPLIQNHPAKSKGGLVFFKNNINRDLYRSSLKTIASHKPSFFKQGDYSVCDIPHFNNSLGISFWFNGYSTSKIFNDNFYLNKLDFQLVNTLILNDQLRLTNAQVSNHNNSSKVLRWAYGYGGLHRKTLEHSHKLTAVKRNLGFGFFDTTLTKQNLWLSDRFSRINNNSELAESLSTHWRTLYESTITQQRQLPYKMWAMGFSPTINNNFNFLSQYETSFLFFIKRSYLFNNLKSYYYCTNLQYYAGQPLRFYIPIRRDSVKRAALNGSTGLSNRQLFQDLFINTHDIRFSATLKTLIRRSTDFTAYIESQPNTADLMSEFCEMQTKSIIKMSQAKGKFRDVTLVGCDNNILSKDITLTSLSLYPALYEPDHSLRYRNLKYRYKMGRHSCHFLDQHPCVKFEQLPTSYK